VYVSQEPRLWHVTLTVAGRDEDPESVRIGLSRLSHERPFIHSIRYRDSAAELQYWEEADRMLDAASLALRLWREHRSSCGLPDWEVVGLEVLERETFRQRGVVVVPMAIGLPGAAPQPF
jgi:hypothetical protein